MPALRCLDTSVVLRDRTLHMNLQGRVVHIVPLKTEGFAESRPGAGERLEQGRVRWGYPRRGVEERVSAIVTRLVGEELHLSPP